MKLHYLVEGRVIGDSKHEEESLAASHVLFAHCAKFLLAGSVQYCNTNIGLDLDETNERKQTQMNMELTGFVQLEIDTSKNKNRSYTTYRLIYSSFTVELGWHIVDNALLRIRILDRWIIIGHEITLKKKKNV